MKKINVLLLSTISMMVLFSCTRSNISPNNHESLNQNSKTKKITADEFKTIMYENIAKDAPEYLYAKSVRTTTKAHFQGEQSLVDLMNSAFREGEKTESIISQENVHNMRMPISEVNRCADYGLSYGMSSSGGIVIHENNKVEFYQEEKTIIVVQTYTSREELDPITLLSNVTCTAYLNEYGFITLQSQNEKVYAEYFDFTGELEMEQTFEYSLSAYEE